MLQEIGRRRFWEGILAQVSVEDTRNAVKRQFSFRFWPIKLALHAVAWALSILLVLVHYPMDSRADTIVGFFDRECENRLYQSCAVHNISNCTGNGQTSTISNGKDSMETKLELIGAFTIPGDFSFLMFGRVVIRGAIDAACSRMQNTSNDSLFEML
jgi:hypothetical protein